MPRRPRIKLAGLPQHVVQRGINRESCLFAEEDYHFYLHWLEKAATDWRYEKTNAKLTLLVLDSEQRKMTLMKKTNAKLTLLAAVNGGADTLISGGGDDIAMGDSGISLDLVRLRSTGKIGQKIELTATNGLEQASPANYGLWRDAA